MTKERDKKIRVLVVDDSALMRKKLSQMINSDEECEVIGTARNGEEGVRMVGALHPDVITLDLEMPKMDGMTTLQYIMSEWPTPVVIVSAYSEFGGQKTIRCLEYGAVDLVAKPGDPISLGIEKVQEELIDKIKAASHANRKILRPALIEKRKTAPKTMHRNITERLVVIASSTGGPKALAEIIPKLPSDLPAAVVVIQHMPEGFTSSMAHRLGEESELVVREAGRGDRLSRGEVLLAPGGFHLSLADDGKKGIHCTLSMSEIHHGVCPSADIAMKSIAPIYGKGVLGVILTGMGSDGVEGLRTIRRYGGRTIAQDSETSVVYGMPRAASEAGVVDEILPLHEIPAAINRWARGF